ncbi:hypothetical protein [Mycolicibacterium hippocampi]|nr:hypothetical protein [Mycolicibacterium hippocampi]
MRVHESHPQLQTVDVVTTVFVFACAACGEEHYVRGARVQADGLDETG